MPREIKLDSILSVSDYTIDQIIEISAISALEDYVKLKEMGSWDIYLYGISYGIYLSYDKEKPLEYIYEQLEEKIISMNN